MDSSSRDGEEFLLLHRVAQRINSVLDLSFLLKQIVSDVAQTFGYCRSAVLLKDDATGDLVITHGWTGDQKKIGDRFQIGQLGIAGHVGKTMQTHYAPDVRVDPYYEIGHPSTRSELDIPLIVRNRLVGIFNVQDTAVDAFSPGRIRLFEVLAGHIATAIDNAQLFERERKEKTRVLKELDEAQSIQRSLLPSSAPPLPGFTITGISLPCRSVGGDWYDCVQLPDGRVAVAVADVAGKGTAAALLMSSTRSILRLMAPHASGPGEILARVNGILLSDFPMSRFVTMVYAIVDPRDRRVTFANAGHPPPLLVGPNGAHFLEDSGGLPLGIREGRFPECDIHLTPGSRLLLYSDGVVEASNSTSEEYGRERLQRHFCDVTHSLGTLLQELKDFSAADSMADDVTAVIVESRLGVTKSNAVGSLT
jgi:sigma-B regulation protein RsbU (phosphoserine phosphatase)